MKISEMNWLAFGLHWPLYDYVAVIRGPNNRPSNMQRMFKSLYLSKQTPVDVPQIGAIY